MPYMDIIQAVLYIAILMFLIYVHNVTTMFLYSLSLEITSWKLFKCSQISHLSPRVESTPNRTKTNHHWLNHLQAIHITLDYATPLAAGLTGSSQAPGVIQGNPSSFS